MTKNQIDYQRHLEDVRTHQATEGLRGQELAEARRSHQAAESNTRLGFQVNERIANMQALNQRVISAMNNKSQERIAASGNTVRATIAELDRLSREDVAERDRLARELGPLGILASALKDWLGTEEGSNTTSSLSTIGQVGTSGLPKAAATSAMGVVGATNIAVKAIPRILKGVILRDGSKQQIQENKFSK